MFKGPHDKSSDTSLDFALFFEIFSISHFWGLSQHKKSPLPGNSFQVTRHFFLIPHLRYFERTKPKKCKKKLDGPHQTGECVQPEVQPVLVPNAKKKNSNFFPKNWILEITPQGKWVIKSAQKQKPTLYLTVPGFPVTPRIARAKPQIHRTSDTFFKRVSESRSQVSTPWVVGTPLPSPHQPPPPPLRFGPPRHAMPCQADVAKIFFEIFRPKSQPKTAKNAQIFIFSGTQNSPKKHKKTKKHKNKKTCPQKSIFVAFSPTNWWFYPQNPPKSKKF